MPIFKPIFNEAYSHVIFVEIYLHISHNDGIRMRPASQCAYTLHGLPMYRRTHYVDVARGSHHCNLYICGLDQMAEIAIINPHTLIFVTCK